MKTIKLYALNSAVKYQWHGVWGTICSLSDDICYKLTNESTFPNQHRPLKSNSRRMKNKGRVINRSLNWTVGGRD